MFSSSTGQLSLRFKFSSWSVLFFILILSNTSLIFLCLDFLKYVSINYTSNHSHSHHNYTQKDPLDLIFPKKTLKPTLNNVLTILWYPNILLSCLLTFTCFCTLLSTSTPSSEYSISTRFLTPASTLATCVQSYVLNPLLAFLVFLRLNTCSDLILGIFSHSLEYLHFDLEGTLVVKLLIFIKSKIFFGWDVWGFFLLMWYLLLTRIFRLRVESMGRVIGFGVD